MSPRFAGVGGAVAQFVPAIFCPFSDGAAQTWTRNPHDELAPQYPRALRGEDEWVEDGSSVAVACRSRYGDWNMRAELDTGTTSL